MAENKLTAYEVEGDIDYQKIIKEFGAELVTPELLKKIKNPHVLLRRGYFFAHRDFDKVLHYYNSGHKFAIVSGRGPSAQMHLPHLLLYKFNKYLQDTFKCYYFFPFSDDEKYLFNPELGFEEVQALAYENALDVAALGFDPKITEFKFDTKHMSQELYNLAIKCAKRITSSTVKAAFGFTDQKNIGISFYPAMQAAHILYPTVKYGLPSLVTVAIDQDVFIKLTRDVAGKLKLPKPACLLSKFVKDLSGGVKMSASKGENAIFTTDTPEEVEKKVNRAFTGGKETIKLQKEKGGNPDVCSVYEYLRLFFIEEDKELENITKECKSGSRTCGNCKAQLIKEINAFLKEHKKNREKAKAKLDLFFKEKGA